jgi:hypothetical protein
VDANGSINIVNALLVAQYYVGIITQFSGASTNPPTPIPAVAVTTTTSSSSTTTTTSITGGGNCGTWNWYGTTCPICSNSDSDPDGDGWVWENEQTCIIQSLCDSQGGNSTTTTSTVGGSTTATSTSGGSGGTTYISSTIKVNGGTYDGEGIEGNRYDGIIINETQTLMFKNPCQLNYIAIKGKSIVLVEEMLE